MRTINNQWKSYLKEVLPKDAGYGQIAEAKKAFFAGAGVVMEIMHADIAELPEDDGVEYMQFLANEIKEWLKENEAG